MGVLDFEFDSNLTRQLEKLADYDKIAEKMLTEGIAIIESNVRREVANHIHTGDLEKSIKVTKPKKNQFGWYSTVLPTGKDKKGVRNVEKLIYLEYGTANQAPRPTMTKAVNNSKAAVNNKLQEIFDREVGGS